MNTNDPRTSTAPATTGNPMMLTLATTGFVINFWAWALLSPLASQLQRQLDLTATQQALVVATPVIVGSVGRVPVGALTDRFGARLMFPLVSALTALPVLYLGYVADSFTELIIGGFVLGLGGTTFAIGIPFVSAWYPPQRRGAALGIFGAGMGGTAIAAFSTVKLADLWGKPFPFLLVAIVLVIYAVVAAYLLAEAPGRSVAPGSLLGRTVAVVRLRSTWELAFLYAVGFGGFVAFSVYLPAYLRNAFELSENDAALRTAGFVVLAVAARPFGGWLSDRLDPARVLGGAFVLITLLAGLAAAEFELMPIGTIAFLGMAAALGAAAGACFALVARMAPQDRVGSVTGFVGAAGGLGGFFPPLVMGAVYGALDGYTLGFVLLALTAAVAATYTLTVMRTEERSRTGSSRPGR